MSDPPSFANIEISAQDWANTPVSVRQLIALLLRENQELKVRLSQIEEQLKQNSQNSSRPPSSDGFGQKPVPAAKGKGHRSRGGQAGHSGHEPHYYAVETCAAVYEHRPEVCPVCGHALTGDDSAPQRHQVIEIPPIAAHVVEHRLHQLECRACGAKTRGQLPADVPQSSYGERLSAIVSWLSSDYRQSHGKVQSLLRQLFGVEISRASINRLRSEMSEALAAVVNAAHRYVQSQGVLHSDETSFTQGNGDGQNPAKTRGWLWVLVTRWVQVFQVVLSRAQAAAKAMIGKNYGGIVVSDRYSSYNWIDLEQRQLCWAHLKRDIQAMVERCGVSQDIGLALHKREQRLLRWWHRVRDGTLSWETFQALVSALRCGFKAELEAAASLPITKQEKTPLAKTVRTCEQLLRVEPALWTFAFTPGIEPTNNAAERALRPAVIWRRTSFGSQSQAGSEFVARLLTVVTSLHAQQRDALDFLTQACRAARLGEQPPSLLPR